MRASSFGDGVALSVVLIHEAQFSRYQNAHLPNSKMDSLTVRLVTLSKQMIKFNIERSISQWSNCVSQYWNVCYKFNFVLERFFTIVTNATVVEVSVY